MGYWGVWFMALTVLRVMKNKTCRQWKLEANSLLRMTVFLDACLYFWKFWRFVLDIRYILDRISLLLIEKFTLLETNYITQSLS